MKINKKGLNRFVKAAPTLILKFTFNIILFSFSIIVFAKLQNAKKLLLSYLLIIFYLILSIIINRLFTKFTLKRILNKSYDFIIFRRKIFLKEIFGENFEIKKYKKDNLSILGGSFVFFLLMNLISIPFFFFIKNIKTLLFIQFIIILFTLFFTLNIIVPLFLFDEYENFRGKLNNEKDT